MEAAGYSIKHPPEKQNNEYDVPGTRDGYNLIVHDKSSANGNENDTKNKKSRLKEPLYDPIQKKRIT